MARLPPPTSLVGSASVEVAAQLSLPAFPALAVLAASPAEAASPALAAVLLPAHPALAVLTAPPVGAASPEVAAPLQLPASPALDVLAAAFAVRKTNHHPHLR